MSQREGQTNYKYEDYASEMATHRPPQTSALVGGKMILTLDSGTAFNLDFIERNRVAWQSGAERGTDWCEAVEVAPNTYFIDMTFSSRQLESRLILLTRHRIGIYYRLSTADRRLETCPDPPPQ